MAETTPGKRLVEITAAMKTEPFNLRDIRRTIETMLASMEISRETRAQRSCVFSKRMWGYGPLISALLCPTSAFSAHSEPSVNLGDPE